MQTTEQIERGRAKVWWTVRVRDPRTGLYLPRLSRTNLFTDAGLSQLAAGWAGANQPPLYLVLDTYRPVLQATYAAGVTSIATDKQVHQPGDTQIVLDPGGVNEETVTWTTVSGTGPYTYTISATTKSHASGISAVRAVRQSDTLAIAIRSEAAYDPVAAPNQRMKASGAGFSPGAGQYTMQFFLTGNQALVYWMTVGLSEAAQVGTGTLQNVLTMGLDHTTAGNDVELDITLTQSN